MLPIPSDLRKEFEDYLIVRSEGSALALCKMGALLSRLLPHLSVPEVLNESLLQPLRIESKRCFMDFHSQGDNGSIIGNRATRHDHHFVRARRILRVLRIQTNPLYLIKVIPIYSIYVMCYLLMERRYPKMRGLRFTDIESKPYTVLDMTSLVVEEFRALVEPIEEQFQAHVAKWRLDGLPRKKRSYSTYKNCPLPTPEDRLLFILAYLKNNPLQTLHGCTFGLPQCKANVWIHVLFPVIQNTFRRLGHAPSRSLAELAKRVNGMQIGSR
jgi:hypothetical protein